MPGTAAERCPRWSASRARRWNPRSPYWRPGPDRHAGAAVSSRRRVDSFAHQKTERQQDAFEAQIAAFGFKPLLGSMRAAALSAGADGDGRNPEGHGDVGVGRSAIEVRADAEVGVHGTQVGEDRRIIR